MKGGGIYFCAPSKRNDRASINKCLIEAMMRPDTVIHPLTFTSMAGFIFTLHRPGGLEMPMAIFSLEATISV